MGRSSTSNKNNLINESYSPEVLKKKKKEILQIINQNESSFNKSSQIDINESNNNDPI